MGDRQKDQLRFAFVAVTLILLNSGHAYGYLDPGTGSMILQSLVAAALGAAFTIKVYWHKIRNFLGHKNAKDK